MASVFPILPGNLQKDFLVHKGSIRINGHPGGFYCGEADLVRPANTHTIQPQQHEDKQRDWTQPDPTRGSSVDADFLLVQFTIKISVAGFTL